MKNLLTRLMSKVFVVRIPYLGVAVFGFGNMNREDAYARTEEGNTDEQL